MSSADAHIAVYILTNGRRGTLYTGVTGHLVKRMYEHRAGLTPGYASEHGCDLLVWYEIHDDMAEAIAREKRIKRWRRAWKFDLVESINPHWDDLSVQLLGPR